jgi:hypothetical protein
MLEGLKEKATQPIGPLPAFAWVIVVVGGYFGYKFLQGRSSGGTTSTTSTPVGATDTSGSVAASSTDVNALTSQIATLGNQINTLTGSSSGSSTTGTPAILGTAWIPKVTKAVDQTTGAVVSLPAKTSFYVLGKSASGYTITYNGQTLTLPISGTTFTLGNIPTGAYKDATTAAAAAVTTTETVASTAVAAAGTPAPAPAFGSNTAVTSVVSNPINVTSAAVASPLAKISAATTGLPTFSEGAIKGSAVQIPTVTSTKKIVPKTVTPPKPTQVVQATKQSIKAA